MPANVEVLPTPHEEYTNDCTSYASCSSEDDESVSLKRNGTMFVQECVKGDVKPTGVRSDWYSSLASRENHEQFFRDAFEILLNEAIFKGCSRENKVLDWKSPEEMKATVDLKLKAEPDEHAKLLQLMRQVIDNSVKTGHPYFVNQLFSAVDPYGLIGQWLTDALNPSLYTYEVAPILTLMEEQVLAEMRAIIGFPEGRGDGIFAPGGSVSNGYAISCARHQFMPDIKERGLHGCPQLVVFTSEDAHYSIKKLASFLGLGSDSVRSVSTDGRGRMRVDELERLIQAEVERPGATPFMVSATSGTTVIGAFDPLEEIADLCQRYGLWFHVDAAWGGGALMVESRRHLLKGIERADSVTWNPHKLLTAPQQCSALLLRHEGILSEAHSAHATYLFQKDKFYDTKYDTGDKHIQCGRRADVLKFWFMWRAKGTEGLAKHVDRSFENAETFVATIRQREGFALVIPEPECTNICFWYIPKRLRRSDCRERLTSVDDDETTAEYKKAVNAVAPKIKERMMKTGSMMVTYQPLKHYPNFFRIVFQNSGLEKDDIKHLVDEFERLGYDL